MASLTGGVGNCTFVDVGPALKDKAIAQFGQDFTKWAFVVQQLAALILTQSGWLNKFQIAFQNAYDGAPADMERYGINSLKAWMTFINDNLVLWIPSENKAATRVYYHIVLFHWLLNSDPVGSLQSPVDPSAAGKPLTLLSRWMLCFADSMGSHLSTLKVTPEIVASFKDPYALEYYVEPTGGWTSLTFNEFFARDIRRKYRPISALEDDRVITSAADAVFDGQWRISAKSTVEFTNVHGGPLTVTPARRKRQTVNAKGVEWSVDELLDTNSAELKARYGVDLRGMFAGGIFIHSFLGTNDFHRQWSPISGTVFYTPKEQIRGAVYLQVDTVPDPDGINRLRPVRKMGYYGTSKPSPKVHARASPADVGGAGLGSLEAPDEPGYQFLQTRGLIIIKSPVIGYVAVMPIGMAQVSSVVVTVKEGDKVKKGDEISHFQFGGSDCIMLFQRQSNVDFTAQVNKQYLAGQQIAVATPK